MRYAPFILLVACGDPLTDGDWLGTPELIVRGTTEPLASEDEADLELTLIWAHIDHTEATFTPERADVGSDRDFGAFELSLYDTPPIDFDDDTLAVALLSVMAVPPQGLPASIDAETLGADMRGVAPEHYVLFVADATRWQDVDGPVLNPIALQDGYNLAVGVCRPGRPSQFLIVPPERVSLVDVDDAEVGQCLDVFWGPWR